MKEIKFPVIKMIICKGVHKLPCKNCPSKHGATDLEVKDILKLPKEKQWETVFPCAWRPNKLCRGYCDTVKFPKEMAENFVWDGK